MLNQFRSVVWSPIGSSNSMPNKMNRFGTTLSHSDYSVADLRSILVLMFARRQTSQRMRGENEKKNLKVMCSNVDYIKTSCYFGM